MIAYPPTLERQTSWSASEYRNPQHGAELLKTLMLVPSLRSDDWIQGMNATSDYKLWKSLPDLVSAANRLAKSPERLSTLEVPEASSHPLPLRLLPG
jgi:hypothetical protein